MKNSGIARAILRALKTGLARASAGLRRARVYAQASIGSLPGQGAEVQYLKARDRDHANWGYGDLLQVIDDYESRDFVMIDGAEREILMKARPGSTGAIDGMTDDGRFVQVAMHRPEMYVDGVRQREDSVYFYRYSTMDIHVASCVRYARSLRA